MSQPKDNKINILKDEPESESLGYQIELLQKLLGLANESKQVLSEIEGFYSDKSISDKMLMVQEITKEFEDNPNFKQQITNSVKSGSLAILKKVLEQPVLLLIIDELETLVNSSVEGIDANQLTGDYFDEVNVVPDRLEFESKKNIDARTETVELVDTLVRDARETDLEPIDFWPKKEDKDAPNEDYISEDLDYKIFLQQLPLLDIFNSLRQRHGFPLGIEEYLIVVRSLKAGFGINNRQELEQLCCTLWAKSEDESGLIHKLFEQMWIQGQDYIPDEIDTRSTSNKKETSDNLEDEISQSELLDESLTENKPIPQIEENPTITLEEDEPVQVVKAIRTRSQETMLNRLRYSLLNEYFPVTKRQMKQSWRYLRRPVREGIPVELDIEETVDKIGREGLLIEPVLMPRRINRTDLVLMVDQEGSMTPFHGLSRQLIETAERGGKLRQTRVFYFHDYVDKYLYRHPALLNAQKLDEMLSQAGERAIILIISDGGAARGKFEEERVKQTQEWINQLQESVRYVAWLNPMPSDSWHHTTAAEIARMLPMFEMSREGMNTAIAVLRGKHIIHNLNLKI